MFRACLSALIVGLPLLATAPAGFGAGGGADGGVEYERDVRPILERHCHGCHGAEQRKSGLRLDVRAGAMAGGDLGPAIVPGEPDESELIARVESDDPTVAMPPKGERLGESEVRVLRDWIARGAEWPEGPGSAGGPAVRSEHWAFRAPERPAPPDVAGRDWCRTPIDRFLLARLEREGIGPSPEADGATLIRRLSLDLLGLPPTPGEVADFLADGRPDAYERLVDRLLASPHFGERWGRHWLDLARYADSDGYEKDSPRPFAYRYRDWVLGAVNADLPFDRFTTEQLAGDLLPDAGLDQKAATGFHRNTLTNREGGVDPEEFRVKAVVDRVDTTGSVWLGLTVGCAQCHSHKYDPLTQREYYGLYAFFDSCREVDLPAPSPAGPSPSPATGDEAPPAVVYALEEEPSPRATHVHVRGDFLRPGEEVGPHTPGVLPPLEPRGARPDRLDLARWLTDPANPLTSRVEVNRAWGHLFGRPLVATPDDFGTRGEGPSHPELLDWLACEFRERGWSRKALIRTIVTSAAYRQSSRSRPELEGRDPRNVLVARQGRFRVEAEVVRDLALAASGLLARRVGGPSVRPPQPSGIAELTYAGSAKWVESRGPDRHRRGLYTWFQRTSPYPTLMTFDAPDANVCALRRERSNTPLQALTLLNDAAFVECARGLARRVLEEADGTEGRVEHAFRLGLGRPPDEVEREALLRLHRDALEELAAAPERAAGLVGGDALPGVGPAEQGAWVVVARAVLNLDEFVTRE